MADFLDRALLGNTVIDWIVAVGVAAAAWLGVRLLLRIALGRMKALAARTETDVDDLVTELLDRTKVLFVALVALWAGARYLALDSDVDVFMSRLLVLGLLVQGALWANGIVNYVLGSWAAKRFEYDPAIATALGSVGFLLRFGVWATFGMVALANLGIDIGPMIAGLGIGGLAMGLALQGTLSDLFASFSIVFDRPFAVGDFIQVDALTGTVEHVGLKTTRLRSLTGEQLVFSNADLLGSRIQNYQRRTERRVVFTLGVTYDTPPSRLARIPDLVRGIIEDKEHTRFERCCFMAFADSSLNFDIVYHVVVPDYATYAATHHQINLEIVQRFEREGIEFAYPTQTLYVEGAGEAAGQGAGA